MKTFFCKLIAPRPLFGLDLSPAEMIAMRDHVAHWTKAMEQGKVIAFGPVADPKGFWGAGIVQMESEAELPQIVIKPGVSAPQGS